MDLLLIYNVIVGLREYTAYNTDKSYGSEDKLKYFTHLVNIKLFKEKKKLDQKMCLDSNITLRGWG